MDKNPIMSDIFLFRVTIRELLRTKNLIGMGLIILLGPVVAAIWRINAAAEHNYVAFNVYNPLMQGMIFGFLLLILTAVFSTSVISQEVEGKTIVYLLTRPVPRWRILLMKFLAVNTVIVGAVWLAALLTALITYGPLGLKDSSLGRDLGILLVAVFAYSGLFLMLGVMVNRAMIYALLFAFGWESWAPSLPGSFGRVSLMTYVRVLAPHAKDAATQDPMAALMNGAEDVISNGTAWMVLLSIIVLTIGIAITLFSVREFVPREEAG